MVEIGGATKVGGVMFALGGAAGNCGTRTGVCGCGGRAGVAAGCAMKVKRRHGLECGGWFDIGLGEVLLWNHWKLSPPCM